MLTRKRNVSSNVTMSVRKNSLIDKPTERVIKMSDKNKYISVKTGNVYTMVYSGEALCVLTDDRDGKEIIVDVESFAKLFSPYTKRMQKQAKMCEDLSALTNLTGEIRKLLDDNYSICHVNLNREMKGLVECTIMLGENV